jgi:GPI-anchor transamidase subunit GAA1
VPPYLSALCILVGVVWLMLLPLNEYSRNTYISENALLPGQTNTYFTGSEHNIFRAYRHEVAGLVDRPIEEYGIS